MQISPPPPVNRALKPLLQFATGVASGYIMAGSKKKDKRTESHKSPSLTQREDVITPEVAADMIDQYQSANKPLTDEHLAKCIKILGVPEEQLADRIQQSKLLRQQKTLDKQEESSALVAANKSNVVTFGTDVEGATGVDLPDPVSTIEVIAPGAGHFSGAFGESVEESHPRTGPLLTDPLDIDVPILDISDIEDDPEDTSSEPLTDYGDLSSQAGTSRGYGKAKAFSSGADHTSGIMRYLKEILVNQKSMSERISGLEQILHSQISVLISNNEDLTNETNDLKVLIGDLSNSISALNRRLNFPSTAEAVIKKQEPKVNKPVQSLFKRTKTLSEKNQKAITDYLLAKKLIKDYEIPIASKVISSLDMEDIEWNLAKLGKELNSCEKGIFYEWDGKTSDFAAQFASLLNTRCPRSEHEINNMESKQIPSRVVRKLIDKTSGTSQSSKTRKDILNMF